MSNPLIEILRAPGGLTLQDMGRIGTTAIGLSQGGAMDKLALIEAATLLGNATVTPAIEFMGSGGSIRILSEVTIALTGAQMPAHIGERRLTWNATHRVKAGDVITLGAPIDGVYGYLTLHAEIDTPFLFASQSSHISAGVGHSFHQGDRVCGRAAGPTRSLKIRPIERFSGGVLRYLSGPQTDLFSPSDIQRFHETQFRASHIANRRGIKVDFDGGPFMPQNAASIVSDIILTGDIQMTGDGMPYVLMSECQTMGGYPRIGTVIPNDLPVLAQSKSGTPIRFEQISLNQADELLARSVTTHSMASQLSSLVRDPAEMNDLLSYQLISGAITGYEETDPPK